VSIDDVARGKPFPDPYEKACELLGCAVSGAIAIEDSAPGVTSAVAAGLFTVAVPHELTRLHDISGAHLVLPSLAGVTLADLAAHRSSIGS
jgi:beta-phosphoglucomutase-like phosphatase (HAD superfamily)